MIVLCIVKLENSIDKYISTKVVFWLFVSTFCLPSQNGVWRGPFSDLLYVKITYHLNCWYVTKSKCVHTLWSKVLKWPWRHWSIDQYHVALLTQMSSASNERNYCNLIKQSLATLYVCPKHHIPSLSLSLSSATYSVRAGRSRFEERRRSHQHHPSMRAAVSLGAPTMPD